MGELSLKMKNNKNEKIPNPVYNTLIGGYSSFYDIDGNRRANGYEYTCLYGKLRFCKTTTDLKDNWIHYSIHWNNVNHCGITWNFHWAIRKKYPFIKIGFKSVWLLNVWEKYPDKWKK